MTRNTSFSIVLLMGSGFLLLPTGAALSDDPAPEEISGWQRLFRTQAAGYKIVVEGHEKSDVTLVSKPVLQWSQPVRGGADGAVFVWTQEGRPVVIGTLFIWPMADGRQGITHELHSLSQVPLVGTWRNQRWTPPANAIVWKPVPDAPKPGDSAERRLRQMRDATRQFQAESHDKNDRKWDLRLLPRPIYRYDLDNKGSPAGGEREVLDGALFGFVEGTDLEIVLLLEARPTDNGPRWEYALARMSDFGLKVSHHDKSVWEVPATGFDNPRVAYYCSTVETRASPDED